MHSLCSICVNGLSGLFWVCLFVMEVSKKGTMTVINLRILEINMRCNQILLCEKLRLKVDIF